MSEAQAQTIGSLVMGSVILFLVIAMVSFHRAALNRWWKRQIGGE